MVIAREKLKKINDNPPKNIKLRGKIKKNESSTPNSSQKKKKIIVGERKNSNVNEIRKLWENNLGEKNEKKKNINTERKLTR